MGFLDKMKAANGLNLGNVESPDFPCCKIVVKDGVPIIVDGSLNGRLSDYPIVQSNVEIFKLVACGACWAKYLIVFKDGKAAYITQEVMTDSQKRQMGSSITMSSIERYIRYTDNEQNYIKGFTAFENKKNKITESTIQNAKEKAEVINQALSNDDTRNSGVVSQYQNERNDQIKNFQTQIAKIINPYFGKDTKGKPIKLSINQEVLIVRENKIDATYDISFTEDKTKHIVEGIPTFYIKISANNF